MIPPQHLKYDLQRNAPLGGQHCNDSYSGVRVTHIPTGVEAFCDFSTSQLRNKRVALNMIEWALVELEVNQ